MEQSYLYKVTYTDGDIRYIISSDNNLYSDARKIHLVESDIVDIEKICPEDAIMGGFALERKLQEIWDYCHKEQEVDIKLGEECRSDFTQGRIIALREIQYLINEKCSMFDDEENEKEV